MKILMFLLLSFIFTGMIAADDPISLDFQRDILSLDGQWTFLPGNPQEEEVLKPAGTKSVDWREGEIPGNVFSTEEFKDISQLKCAWFRREFMVDGKFRNREAVLKWNGIRFGASVWINGILLIRYAPIGPNTVLIPSSLVHPGRNEILIKANGWGGIPKAGKPKSSDPEVASFPLVPVGASTQGWGSKVPAIYDDIWLEFYDKAYMKWIYAMPDIDHTSVTFRLWLDALDSLPRDLTLNVEVFDSARSVIGKGVYDLDGSKNHQDVKLSLTKLELWSPDHPSMNSVSLTLRQNGRLCDSVSFNYGMKCFEVKNGDYYLNHTRIRLHGSNLVNEWYWGRDNVFNRNTKKYIVDEARNMNLNCFRTHSIPPVTNWLDTADIYGTMILAEMPILYNYANPSFTAENWKTFHRNALTDVTGWITKLWNHPSLILWVMTNESNIDNEWEQTTLRDYFKTLDPERPVLRSGAETKESYDIHLCNNFNDLPEGTLMENIMKMEKLAGPDQTFSNTEYMNLFSPWKAITQKYLGSPDNPYDRLNQAEIAMEHTEFMRQHDLDLILPYMYAGWTGLRGQHWRTDYPTPMAAALHSSMSPVLASAGLWNRNFTSGEVITFPLHMINDLARDVNAGISVYVTEKDPEFIPDQDVLGESHPDTVFRVTLKALSHKVTNMKIALPSKSGTYFLSVVLTRDGDRPVTSQRVVRTILPGKPEQSKKILLLGGDEDAETWLNEHHYSFTTAVTGIRKAGTILVWDAGLISRDVRSKAGDILAAVQNGARLVIMEQEKWDWDELADFSIHEPYGKSRAFIFDEAKDDPLFRNTGPEYFLRWNGIPFNVAERELKGPFIDEAEKLIWAESPEIIYAAKQHSGKGEILLSGLLIKKHIQKPGRYYDPVAEQLLFNYLGN